MFWEYNYQMPEVNRSSENGAIEKVSVSYNLPKGYEWREELPSVGAYCEGFGYYTGYQFTESPGYDIIRMNFAAQPTSDLPSRDNRKAGDVVWNFHLFNYERDIRLHPNYLTYWSYNLAAKKGITAVPEWGETAEDITIPDADKEKYRWVADTNEIPEGWGVCLKRLYTFESYKRFTATATCTSYYKDYESAKNAVLSIPCSLSVPATSIPGCSSEANKWMIEDVAVSGDGDLFTLTEIASYNEDGWVTEVYNNA